MPKKMAFKNLTPGARLWRNRNFNIFWFGQTLSVMGDAFAVIAIPLLVLQATGSVAQMGLVTGVFGVGQVAMGIFAGLIVDRVDRRRLMILCDLLRTILYFSIPLCWWLVGPQLWLIFVVTALGSCLGMTFQITYVTTIANLVDSDQLTEANSRMQVTYAIAFVVGPVLAGVISGTFGSSFAINLDALSFAISAISIFFIRLRPVSQNDKATDQQPQTHDIKQEFLAGLQFLWQQPTLRWITILLAILSMLTSGALDLFMFHLKHDLKQSDNIVGIIFGLASLGALIGGLIVPIVRKRWGFAVCWIGGFSINSLCLVLIGLSSNLNLIALFAIGFTCTSTLASIASLSLRQEITPSHLLGRVTSAFWTITAAPGPIGAALFTALTEYIGTRNVCIITGGLGTLIILSGIFTPLRQKHPEHSVQMQLPSNVERQPEGLISEITPSITMLENEIYFKSEAQK